MVTVLNKELAIDTLICHINPITVTPHLLTIFKAFLYL